jgi:hypothetical protein
MRKSIVRLVLLVMALSLGALALSPTARGAEKKTLHNISESYVHYYDGIDPTYWGYMQ